MECDSVCRFLAAIRLCTKLPANCDLRSKTHDPHPDLIIDQSSYRLMNVSGIGGKKGSKDYEYLAGAVTRSMAVFISVRILEFQVASVKTYKSAPRAISKPF